jgi:ABC-type transport system involved in multi-copper enzyme maturation permease subunit
MALAWLTLRQAVPMCLPGLAIALLMTPLQMQNHVAAGPTGLLREFIDALPSSMWMIGVLWSVVVGAGIFSAEIDSRLGEFWRPLPLPAGKLFAAKFLVVLLVVLLVLDGATIAATWNSPNWGDYHSMNWPYIGCMVPLHATMFAIAVAWTCLLRRAVLGGMAAIVSFTLTNTILEWSKATRDLNPIQVYNKLHNLGASPVRPPLDFTAHGYPLVATAMGLILLACIVIGWQALRRYQPRFQSG